MTGRIRYFSWVGNDAPGPALADDGRIFRPSAKMTITTIPDTNSGTVAAESPVSEMPRSSARPTFSAAMTPPRMPSGMIRISAKIASLAEFTSALPRIGATGVRYW